MVPWAHPSPHPKRHFDRFSCFFAQLTAGSVEKAAIYELPWKFWHRHLIPWPQFLYERAIFWWLQDVLSQFYHWTFEQAESLAYLYFLGSVPCASSLTVIISTKFEVVKTIRYLVIAFCSCYVILTFWPWIVVIHCESCGTPKFEHPLPVHLQRRSASTIVAGGVICGVISNVRSSKFRLQHWRLTLRSVLIAGTELNKSVWLWQYEWALKVSCQCYM